MQLRLFMEVAVHGRINIYLSLLSPIFGEGGGGGGFQATAQKLAVQTQYLDDSWSSTKHYDYDIDTFVLLATQFYAHGLKCTCSFGFN